MSDTDMAKVETVMLVGREDGGQITSYTLGLSLTCFLAHLPLIPPFYILCEKQGPCNVHPKGCRFLLSAGPQAML